MVSFSYSNEGALIETEELVERLDDSCLRIIEMGTADGGNDVAHIPGAHFWTPGLLLDKHGSITTDEAQIQQLLEQTDIAPNSELVIAHTSHRGTSGWLYWFLDRLDNPPKLRVLNGGKEKWLAQRMPLASKRPEPHYSKFPVNSISQRTSCSTEAVKDAMNDTGTALLDVRTKAEFDGQIYLDQPPQLDERAGHIPGAIHLHCDELHRDDGTFLPAESLIERLSEAGVTENKKTITYCAVGARSAHVWFILTQLIGWTDVKNYSGSWREWSATLDNPVA